MQVALGAGVVGGLLGLLALLSRAPWLDPEVRRKAMHVAAGLAAIALPYAFSERWPVWAVLWLSLALLLVLRHPRFASGIAAPIHAVARRSWGEIFLVLAVGFVFLRSEGAPILYVLPLAVVTLSDAAAALAGSAYGRRIFRVADGTKSIEGVVVFFVVTWLVALVLLLLLTDVGRLESVALSFAIAVFSALVEADSWKGLDNLFVPVAVHFFLQGYLEADALGIAAITTVFGAFVLGATLSASALGIGRQSARGAAVVLFVVAGVSGPVAALAPAIAILAHLAARELRPDRSRHSDLDALATFCAVALVWLAVGETAGPSAINFFAVTFAGIAVVSACLFAPPLSSAPVRALGVAAAAIAAASLLAGLAVALNAPEKAWHGPLLAPATTSFVLCAGVTLANPAFFDRWRAPRAASLAAALPLATYLLETLR